MTLNHFNLIANQLALSHRAREAVSLIEIEGMSNVAAARQLDLSASTVSRAHGRFVEALRQSGARAH